MTVYDLNAIQKLITLKNNYYKPSYGEPSFHNMRYNMSTLYTDVQFSHLDLCLHFACCC